MAETRKLLASFLQLFADGGADGGAAGTQAGPDSSQPGDTGGEETVLYGRQPEEESSTEGSDAGSEGQTETQKETEESPREREARYQKLVKEEFKDFYQRDTQRMIDRRFKETKSLQERLEAYQPILDGLLARYNIEDGDMDRLRKALDSDNAWWAHAAEEAGMEVEQFKNFQRMQQENRRYRMERESLQARETSRRQAQQWMEEAEELRADYPDFDLGTFLQEPQNVEYLKHHVPIRMVYEYANRERIQTEVAAKAAQQTEKNVTENIRSKGSRPKENGAAAQAGVVVKSNVDELTNADIDEIMKRVRRGETISF